MREEYQSWGRYPEHAPKNSVKIFWREEIPDLRYFDGEILPFGLGRSYGDSCQLDGGTLIDTSPMNKLIDFDNSSGSIRCEAGVSLEQVLDFIIPHGYFLPTTPGTKYVTIAGAIANDVHGKNHHINGTFGRHVFQFELLRSDGSRVICSSENNSDLYKATIGGLGLTGLITWAEFRNQKVKSEYIEMESIKFNNLDEFFELNEDSIDFTYTVSWVDTTSSGSNLGRGIYSRGEHADPDKVDLPLHHSKGKLPFPLEISAINPLTVNLFNVAYFNKQIEKKNKMVVHYNPFFYPLDAVNNWNKAYGRNGFIQYQFVIPHENGKKNLTNIIKKISDSGMSSFLTVLKTFGDVPSPGMLSFPRPGITMAVDFKFEGRKTLEKLNELDILVKSAGGILYPAKDSRMSGKDFREFYPQWEEFSKFIDPKFSSDFWKRVTS